jgi:hypothetical protein
MPLAQGKRIVLITPAEFALLKVWTRPADLPKVKARRG